MGSLPKRISHMKLSKENLILSASLIIGGGSLLAFGAFLYAGTMSFVALGFSPAGAIIWDTFICLPFFILHSGMIRPEFRRRLSALLNARWHGALYSILSGMALLVVVGFWQPSNEWAYRVSSPWNFAFRAVFFATGIGFALSVRALDDFDPLGLRQTRGSGGPIRRATTLLTVTGPYRWVRHPLYFLSLVLIWAHPAVTTDRLMFNLLWSLWIVMGAHFEERDLLARFGSDYLRYQRCVPMLLPHRRPCRSEVPCGRCSGKT